MPRIMPVLSSVALLVVLWSSTSPAFNAQSDPPSSPIVARIRDNLKRERKMLLEYVYRERRRPMRVSPLGKVTVGEEQLLDVYPSADPDRPMRVLVSVGGRPATAAERAEFARRSGSSEQTAEQRRERERRDAETRRRAQERLDDAFRIYQFETDRTELVNGIPTRVVRVMPQPGVEARSDLGKWMKKFRGTAWIDETHQELSRLEMIATDTISLGWGVVGRIAEGTTITYDRRPTGQGFWFPAKARFEARGRTLLFRSFEVDLVTEWFDYRPYSGSPTPPAFQ